jgi:hypothetical protein
MLNVPPGVVKPGLPVDVCTTRTTLPLSISSTTPFWR